MSGIKISALTALTSTPSESAVMPIVESGVTKKISVSQLRQIIPNYNFVSIRDFGAVGDGATDDTLALQEAITFVATTGRFIFLPAGTYRITSVLSTSGHLNMFGEGNKSVLDFSSIVSAAGYGISVSGSLTALPSIVSASAGNLTIPFASAPSITTNDVFILHNRNSYSYSSYRPDYQAGEWFRCREVSGNNAFTTTPLYDSYVAADIDTYKLNSKDVNFLNFRAIGSPTLLGLFKISLCEKVKIQNITGYHENNYLIYLDRCYDSCVLNCDFYNKGDGGDDYGLAIGNSQNIQVLGGNYYSRRHAITIGGGGATGNVPNRNIRIRGVTLSNDINSGVASADYHGNTEDSSYENSTIYGGILLSGKNNGYRNCTVTNFLDGICSYGSEIKGGTFFLKGCRFITLGSPASVNRGIIDFGGSSNAITSGCTNPLSIVVTDCEFEAPASVAGECFVKLSNRGTTQNINFYISGIKAIKTGVNYMVVLKTTVGGGGSTGWVANSQGIVIDNLSNFPAGTILHEAGASGGGNYLGFPHRCQRQSGKVSLTATSGQFQTVAAAQTLKYAYPRTPYGNVTTGSSTALTYNATRLVLAGIYTINSTSIRPYIATADQGAGWTATVTTDVNWTVGIEEV